MFSKRVYKKLNEKFTHYILLIYFSIKSKQSFVDKYIGVIYSMIYYLIFILIDVNIISYFIIINVSEYLLKNTDRKL